MIDRDASKAEKHLRAILTALGPFEAIWGINAPLNPPDDAPLREYTPGVWPEMGDLRNLVVAADAARAECKIRKVRR